MTKKDRIAELVLLLEMEAKSKSTNTIQSGIKNQSIDVPQEKDRHCEPKKRLMPSKERGLQKMLKSVNDMIIPCTINRLPTNMMLPDATIQSAGLPVSHIHQGLIVQSNVRSEKNQHVASVVLFHTV